MIKNSNRKIDQDMTLFFIIFMTFAPFVYFKLRFARNQANGRKEKP